MFNEIDPNEIYTMEEIAPYVIERDNYLCQLCGKEGGEIHHIKYRSKGGKNRTKNLILLCNQHHYDEHSVRAMDEQFYYKKVEKNEKLFRERLI